MSMVVRINPNNIRVPPNNHEIIVCRCDLRVLRQSGLSVIRIGLNVVIVAIYPKSSLKHRM